MNVGLGSDLTIGTVLALKELAHRLDHGCQIEVDRTKLQACAFAPSDPLNSGFDETW